MITPAVPNDEAEAKFPKGFEVVEVPSGKGYLRITPQPNLDAGGGCSHRGSKHQTSIKLYRILMDSINFYRILLNPNKFHPILFQFDYILLNFV